ncbi:MAG: transcriptional regulator, LysR family [Bradyrhizobium sp.]|nr:transcriptional regulator, LysR family [Bradyrhizobium sp.]
MELRHLRYFVAVAEELSFTRAAMRLNIAQPPLSVQIRKLEAEIGTELFLREGRVVRLSEAGKVFLQHARQMLAQARLSITMARRAASGAAGHLAIGYGPAAEFRVFPEIIPPFKLLWPDVHLTFHDLNIPEQIDALRRDELDLSFIWLPVPGDEFDVAALTVEPFVAVLPAGHRLARGHEVSIADLSREPLVLFERARDPDTYFQIEQQFLKVGAIMNVVYELENMLSAINFVAMGSGYSILADYARSVPRKGVVFRPLAPAPAAKTLGVIKKRGRGGLAESLYRFAAENIAGALAGQAPPAG